MPWCYQICIVKCIYSYRDNLSKKYNQKHCPVKNAKSPRHVDERRSKTPLLNLPNPGNAIVWIAIVYCYLQLMPSFLVVRGILSLGPHTICIICFSFSLIIPVLASLFPSLFMWTWFLLKKFGYLRPTFFSTGQELCATLLTNMRHWKVAGYLPSSVLAFL